MSRRSLFSVVITLALLAGMGFIALAWHLRVAVAAVPNPASFDNALVRRGTTLAALGNRAV